MTPDSLKAHLSQSLIQDQPKSVGGILDAIYKALLPVAVDSIKQHKDLILAAYDEACATIDIPRIPEFFEVRLERVGRNSLEALIDSLGA